GPVARARVARLFHSSIARAIVPSRKAIFRTSGRTELVTRSSPGWKLACARPTHRPIGTPEIRAVLRDRVKETARRWLPLSLLDHVRALRARACHSTLPAASPCEVRLDFVIVGAEKAGTTLL